MDIENLTQADSSPAPEPSSHLPAATDFATWTSEEQEHWEATGERPPKAESAPAKQPAEPEKATAPESAPDEYKEFEKRRTQERFEALLAERKEYARQAAEWKAKVEAYEAEKAKQQAVTGRPRLNQFEDVEQWEDAMATWLSEQQKRGVEQHFSQIQQKAAKLAAEAAEHHAERQAETAIAGNLLNAAEKNPAVKTVLGINEKGYFSPDAYQKLGLDVQDQSGRFVPVSVGAAVVGEFLAREDMGPEVWVHLIQNAKDLAELKGMSDPMKAHRKLIAIENAILSNSRPKIPSNAHPSPEIGAGGAAAESLDRIVAGDDFGAYQKWKQRSKRQ